MFPLPAALLHSILKVVPSSFWVSVVAVHLSWGLPWGAAGLPGRQIPQRGEWSVGVAAGRDPDPTVDVLLHPTLLRTSRETTTYDRKRGEVRIAFAETLCFLCADALAAFSSSYPLLFFFFKFQLLQAFYRQQDEIRGLREQLNHKDVSIQTQSHSQPSKKLSPKKKKKNTTTAVSIIASLGSIKSKRHLGGLQWLNVSVVQVRITQLELEIKNTRNNMRATFWSNQSDLTLF